MNRCLTGNIPPSASDEDSDSSEESCYVADEDSTEDESSDIAGDDIAYMALHGMDPAEALLPASHECSSGISFEEMAIEASFRERQAKLLSVFERLDFDRGAPPVSDARGCSCPATPPGIPTTFMGPPLPRLPKSERHDIAGTQLMNVDLQTSINAHTVTRCSYNVLSGSRTSPKGVSPGLLFDESKYTRYELTEGDNTISEHRENRVALFEALRAARISKESRRNKMGLPTDVSAPALEVSRPSKTNVHFGASSVAFSDDAPITDKRRRLQGSTPLSFSLDDTEMKE